MKFLKNNLKLIIGFVIGAVLTGGIVYAAVTSATEITYSTNKNEEVETVADALNDLYSIKNNIDMSDAGEFIGRFATSSTFKNNKVAPLTIDNLTVGEKYFMVILRASTGGTNAVISDPSMSATTFSNMTCTKIIDNCVYNFTPTDTSVTINFGSNTGGNTCGGYSYAFIFKGSLKVNPDLND